ncbi:WD repeat-containing and planar cell polarity effector protein fritz homolog [Eucyclogobius newberryi]|uniref:WD repeat-containing and planar cell polarity effector protein fritz homolog n=1 Tax=Eucyclogobius newberryi TaxID=166745 RepID=UPI003B5A2DA3
MAFCLAELHLWSTKSSLQVNDTDIGTYQYYDKGEPAGPLEHHYYKEKLHLCEARGYTWNPRNHRPEKLRDSLKELEELLLTNTCVHTRWKSKHCCQLMLSSGILITLSLNGPELEQVCVDRTLVGRLPANTVTDAVITDRLILLSFLEKSQLCAVHINKKNLTSSETVRKVEKLSPSESKLFCVELSGPGSGLHRRITLNRQQDVALCWWSQDECEEELWPWSPTDAHRNNLVLLNCSPTDGLKILCSICTEGSPIDCHFSLLQPYQLLTVELPQRSQTSSEGPCADSCVYECARGRLHRLSVTHIPLPSQPTCCSCHPSESMLLLALKDSSLVLYDHRRGVSLLVSCPVPPAHLAWHPSGALAVVGGGQAELMCFDVGLAPLGLTLLSEEMTSAATLPLAQHLRCTGSLEALHWGSGLDGGPEGTMTLMLAFHSGPLGVLRFRFGTLSGGQMGPEELLQQRLRCGQVREALSILEAMDFNTAGDQCFRGLSSIINHLLRLPLNMEREHQLEAALGVFYAAPAPLCDTVLLEYRDPVSKYARRFFHHLLRHQRFEKAFLLAVDLEDRDLYMDLHYVASDKGEVVLADVSKRKANEIEARVDADFVSGAPAPSLGDRQTERNPSATGPSQPPAPTTRSGRKASVRSAEAETLRVTVSAAAFRTLGHSGLAEGDKATAAEDVDPGTLQVVHLGMV